MGYLATEMIVLLGGAAVLGLIIGWALFGLGKKSAPAAGGAQANPKVETELKAERDARKKAEGRIFELEAKETNFNERLQERDTKVAELSHQLDDLSKYRVQSAAELDARDQRINALDTQLKQRDADLAKAAGAATIPTGNDNEKLAEKDRTIAKLKADLDAAKASGAGASAASTGGGDDARIRELERENAELRQTLIMTDGAAPTTSGEKDAIIARLNEEVTGLRAAYESAEQALEEQDAAIDKLTRDLQATQHKLAQASPGDARPSSGLIPAAQVKPTSVVTQAPKVEPAKAEPPKAEPPKAQPAPAAKVEPPKAAVVESEATVAVSLADLIGEIDKAPAKPAAPPPMPAAAVAPPVQPAPAPQPAPAYVPPAKPAFDSESTVAISLADLVGQIDQKAAATTVVPAPPAPAPVAPAPAPVAAPATLPVSEATVAMSLADLVGKIDVKPTPPPPPAASFDSESTMAISLDALVAQIDAKPLSKPAPAPAPEPVVAAPAPAPAPPPPAAVDYNESTVAVSLADLVGAIDGGVSEMKVKIKPAPEGALDDLKEIRGIGPATEKRLNSAGIVTWTQMAGLTEIELTAVADLLKISVDKIKREQWVEQARALGGKG